MRKTKEQNSPRRTPAEKRAMALGETVNAMTPMEIKRMRQAAAGVVLQMAFGAKTPAATRLRAAEVLLHTLR
jgi:hypothetical protein